MTYDLAGKIVFITGGAQGIGFETAKELLRNGAQGITIADLNPVKGEEATKELNKEFGPNRVIFVKTDVTKVVELEAAFKATIEAWKTVDVVINNAGIMNDGQWELEIFLNCNALVQGTFLGLQYMGKDKGGKGGIIVNLASTLGLQPLPLLPVYCGTKHFVMGFSRSMGDPYHYQRTGVKILTICPHATNTSLLPESIRHASNVSPDIKEDLRQAFEANPPQRVEHVASGLVSLIKKGENGAVWVVEDDEPPYELIIPDRTTFERLQQS